METSRSQQSSWCLARLRFPRSRGRLLPRPTEAIPEAIRQKGHQPFLISRLAHTIRLLVYFRLGAIPRVGSTPRLAPGRFLSTPLPGLIQLLARERFLATRPAIATRPLERS